MRWFVKLVSCAMQQKLFGENLSGSVGVRYAVGVNSVQMRAIRYCLLQPGFSAAKIAILCGGPDWQGGHSQQRTLTDARLTCRCSYRRWIFSSI